MANRKKSTNLRRPSPAAKEGGPNAPSPSIVNGAAAPKVVDTSRALREPEAVVDPVESSPGARAFPVMSSPARRLARSIEADRGVVYGVARPLWGVLSAPVTIVLMAGYFTPEIQGYYYTFAHLLWFQVLVEMGLGQVIQNIASHEWFKLRLAPSGAIDGDERARSRLLTLGRLAIRWYLLVGVGVAAGLGTLGIIFFSRSTQSGVAWRGPWLLLCLTTGISLCLTPMWSLLEGCNQMRPVYGFRLFQAFLNRIAIWLAIVLGAGLWTGPLASAIDLFAAAAFLSLGYRRFFASVLSGTQGEGISWRNEVWPLQWPTALSWLSSYAVFALFTPLLFRFHGAVLAGQMGMTWVLVSALSQISTTWLMTRAPRFAMLVAGADYSALDQLFVRSALASVAVAWLGAVSIEGGVVLLDAWHHPLAARLLPPLPTAMFLLATVLIQAFYAESVYLRAHKREPLMSLSVAAGASLAVLALVLGREYGATGIGVAYVAVVALGLLPVGTVITLRCRRAWHGQATALQGQA